MKVMRWVCRVAAFLSGTLPLFVACAARAQDSDGDGYCDDTELLRGSDPKDPASTPSPPSSPVMFEASFIMHAFGNDTDTGATSPYVSNFWTALPLGYDCAHAEPFTLNGGPSSRYCSASKMQKGHPAQRGV